MKRLICFFVGILVLAALCNNRGDTKEITPLSVPTKPPSSYVLEKFKNHDIVFLGTKHKKPKILKFLSSLLPELSDAKVSYIGLEIASDQQDLIDHYIQSGEGLERIRLHHALDCPEYKNLFRIIRGLEQNKRPKLIAIDLPPSLYKSDYDRDAWMANSIYKIFDKDSDSKILIITGNLHILKKIEWEKHVLNKNGTIRSYLTEIKSDLNISSICLCVDCTPDRCDFCKYFGGRKDPVGIDCTEIFSDWHLGIMAPVAARPLKNHKMIDGIIVF